MPWCGGTPQQNVGELTNRTLTEPKYIDRLRPLLSAASEVTAAIGLVTSISPYRFFPALRPSIDGYPRRRNARSIPSETQIPGLPSGSYLHSATLPSFHSMAVGYFCASARIKFDIEQFAALFNEPQARGDQAKLMQLFGH